MKRTAYLAATRLAASFFCAAFVAIAVAKPRPALMWNASASTAIGLYRIDYIAQPALGDLVVVTPAEPIARLLAERQYLPRGVPLMKHVAALPGQTVCRNGAIVSIDGRPVVLARPHDREARPLPSWRGCRRVARGALFLLNRAETSLDGRYFGPMAVARPVGRARPLLTRAAPGAPLRWHGFARSAPDIPSTKDRLP